MMFYHRYTIYSKCILPMRNYMRLSNRKQLLREAEIELQKIVDSIRPNRNLNEDFESLRTLKDIESKISKLKIKAKEFERTINQENNQSMVVSEKKKKQKFKSSEDGIPKKPTKTYSWRDQPVYSRYALSNLPPTDKPKELAKRERMRIWQEVNKKLIDSWNDYSLARMDLDYIVDRSTIPPTVYTKEGRPIKSKKRPGKIATKEEYYEMVQDEIRASRKGFLGLIKNILDELWFTLSP